MKKFQFRLQKLLWYHQQRQKRAEVMLQRAVMLRQGAFSEVQAVQAAIDHACRHSESAGMLVNISSRESVAEHLQTLERTLTAAQKKLMQMEQQLREASQVCTQITRDVEGLLHLRAQQLVDHTDEVARQQQIVLDEVVMRQWSLRDADATA